MWVGRVTEFDWVTVGWVWVDGLRVQRHQDTLYCSLSAWNAGGHSGRLASQQAPTRQQAPTPQVQLSPHCLHDHAHGLRRRLHALDLTDVVLGQRVQSLEGLD